MSASVLANTAPAGAQATAAAAVPKKRRRRRGAWSYAGIALLVVLLLFSVLPMLWMFLTSIKTQFAALQYPPQYIPVSPTLQEYEQLLSPQNEVGREFLGYFINSLWVSFASTLLGIVVAVPAAYAFSRFRFPGRNLLFYSVLLRNMFPAVVFLMPLFILMRWLGLVNTSWSLILTYLTFGLPLSIWLLKGFYDNIPIQLEQAARIDGATRFQAFVLIVMPLSSPGIIATSIYSFILAWNEYVYALTFLNDKSKLTLPVGLQRFFAEYSTDWPGLMAASFIMSVPVVVLFLILQKYFVKALTEGAVKS
ncbi:MAG TPA: carbohydrate ABC transporter permease [Microvirga sp.]|jgi:multiple sugar transport system permease protein|nr:carbohydrate ABC transporter permease [Microvirga sp.]